MDRTSSFQMKEVIIGLLVPFYSLYRVLCALGYKAHPRTSRPSSSSSSTSWGLCSLVCLERTLATFCFGLLVLFLHDRSYFDGGENGRSRRVCAGWKRRCRLCGWVLLVPPGISPDAVRVARGRRSTVGRWWKKVLRKNHMTR